jgi:hypothetical protein
MVGKNMDYAAILKRTETCFDGLPKRDVRLRTQKDYRKTFARMLREPILDPLKPNIARKTYGHRRAALHWGSRFVLERTHERLEVAAGRNDPEAARLHVAELERLLSRIEPALERDPPLKEGTSALRSSASRWKAAAGPHPKRSTNSKRDVLGLLPPRWDGPFWESAREVWKKPPDQPDLDALAVRLLAPVRTADFMPGERSHGWSEGVKVHMHSVHCLHITIAPAKSHQGRYGTGVTIIKIDPNKAGAAASYLAARCSDGAITISLVSPEASRKKLMRLGKIALPDCDVTITPNVFRNQVIADWKATVGAGIAVAAACGHCTDRTQAKYGRVQHGRRRRGIIGVASMITPRTGNVARSFELRKPPNNDLVDEVGTQPASNDTASSMDLVDQCSKSSRAKVHSPAKGLAEDCGVQRRNVSETCSHSLAYPLFGASGGP